MLEPKFSLAYYKRHPLFAVTPRVVHLPHCAKVSKEEKNNLGSVNPDTEAVHFYYLNHLWAQVCQRFEENEVLPPEYRPLVEKYLAMASAQAARMFTYTLLVITRESRHMHPHDTTHKAIKDQFGDVYLAYLKSIKGGGSSTVANSIVNTPPDMDLMTYVNAIEYVFFKGSFHGGYGGAPWGHIAANLGRLIRGETSYEMMVDTAYTLAHNNGPMFNKGMLYDQYTSEFYKILDVQRSGQMPQYVREEGQFADIQNIEDKLKLGVHMEPTTYVDWFKVEALGALKKYTHEKKLQLNKHGASPYANGPVEEPSEILMPNHTTKMKAKDPAPIEVPSGFKFKKQVQYGASAAETYTAMERA